MGLNYPPDLKDRIAKVLSEILSDKYDAKITIRFEPKEEVQKDAKSPHGYCGPAIRTAEC